MSLAEKAESLCERIKKVKEFEHKEHVAQNAGDKSGALAKLRLGLEHHRGRASALGLKLGACDWPDVATSQTALAAFRAALKTHLYPSETAVDEAFQILKQALPPVEKKAKEIVEARIHEATAALKNISQGALETWTMLSPEPQKVATAMVDLKKLLDPKQTAWLKLSAAELEQAVGRKVKVIALADSLMQKAMPPEVMKFMQNAAQQGGAHAAEFTDEVRKWLDQNNQLGRVRVIFK